MRPNNLILNFFRQFCYELVSRFYFTLPASKQSIGQFKDLLLVRISFFFFLVRITSKERVWLDDLGWTGYNKKQCLVKYHLIPDKQAAEHVGTKYPEEALS